MTNLVMHNTHISYPPSSTSISSSGDAAGLTARSASRRPSQVAPASSAMELAARTLAAATVGRPSYATIHNAKIGAMLKGFRRNDALLSRTAVNHISRRLIQSRDPRMEELMRMVPDDEDTDAIMRSLRRKSTPQAAMVLVISGLAMSCPPGRRRTQLDRELEKLLADGTEWELRLLGWLELGTVDERFVQQMKALYQCAAAGHSELSKFFDRMLKVSDRKKKIRILIQALGADLSGVDSDPVQGTHLASVIRDLRRLLHFLGFDEACNSIARQFDVSGLTEDFILRLVIRMIDQFSIYPEWIANQLSEVPLTPANKEQFMHELIRLFKLFPDACFRDLEQRGHLIDAVQNAITPLGGTHSHFPMRTSYNGHTKVPHGTAQT